MPRDNDTPIHNEPKQRWIGAIVVLYFLALAPIMPHVSVYHGDEQFYTNSSIYMLQHQEYLTPYYGDGSLRTKKPILSYWAIMVSYTLFGINFFAARLPFLLLGSMTLWVTYRLSMLWYKEHQRLTATLAAIILATNFQFVSLSIRATPDVMQLLFMTISLYGFVAIIHCSDKRRRNYIFAYYGAALAVLTKGALGLVLVAFVFAFLLSTKTLRRTIKDIVHWPIMITALGVALSWYLYIIYQYGVGSLWDFVSDQVAGKVVESKFYMVVNIKDYLVGVFRNFLPWGLILFFGIHYRREVQAWFSQQKRASAFVLGWFSLLLLIFMGSIDRRTRYLVYAYPLLSVWLAGLIVTLGRQHYAKRMWRSIEVALVIVAVLLGIALMFLGVNMELQLIVAAMFIFAGVAFSRYLTVRQSGPLTVFASIGMLLLVLFSSVQALVLPAFDRKPAHQIVACVSGSHEHANEITIWSFKSADHLRQVYIASKGRMFVKYFSDTMTPEDLKEGAMVVITQNERHLLDTDQFTIEPCGYHLELRNHRDVIQALISRKKELLQSTIQKPIYLAHRIGKI